jgi:thymidylate synthase
MNGQDSQIAHHRNLKEQASANVSAFIFNKDKYTANEAVYLQGLHDIATKGRVKYSRPGQTTLSLSGTQQRFDLTDGKIPLLGSKEIFHRSFLIENQWFLSGDDDIKFLKDRNVSIWDSWVIPETAVFAPTEKQTGSDVENYIRCHYPQIQN